MIPPSTSPSTSPTQPSDWTSTTAATVLAGVYLTACDPSTTHRVPPDLASFSKTALLALGGASARRVTHFQSRPYRALVRCAERIMLPGICTHYTARKSAIFNLAINSPVANLVVLGAGFDGLAYRLASVRPDLQCFEIDHPNTQQEKRKILAALPPAPLTLLPCNLTEPAQVSNVFASLPTGPTLIVAEGVLMYLPPPTVSHLLSLIASHASHAILSFMQLHANGQPGFAARPTLVRHYLRRAREPFLWGLSPHHAQAFFFQHSLRLTQLIGAPYPPTPITPADGLIPGEYLAALSSLSPPPQPLPHATP